jgi:MEMO1 family protein
VCLSDLRQEVDIMGMEARKLEYPVRPAAVAGHFYPADPGALEHLLANLLAEAAPRGGPQDPPKAIIVPHAGYRYSGPVAAHAFARLEGAARRIRRVVLMGTGHRVGFYGIAVPDAQFFETPLGMVAVDQAALERACALPGVFRFDAAHRSEHSLEVQLPFLQRVVGHDFLLVPLVAGSATADDVARVLALLWGGPETLVVVSSDLSHHLDYESARRVDQRTSRAIESLDEDGVAPGLACGRVPIQGLLRVARQHHLKARCLDLRSSGDTVGPPERVVGYGAYEFA